MTKTISIFFHGRPIGCANDASDHGAQKPNKFERWLTACHVLCWLFVRQLAQWKTATQSHRKRWGLRSSRLLRKSLNTAHTGNWQGCKERAICTHQAATPACQSPHVHEVRQLVRAVNPWKAAGQDRMPSQITGSVLSPRHLDHGPSYKQVSSQPYFTSCPQAGNTGQ